MTQQYTQRQRIDTPLRRSSLRACIEWRMTGDTILPFSCNVADILPTTCTNDRLWSKNRGRRFNLKKRNLLFYLLLTIRTLFLLCWCMAAKIAAFCPTVRFCGRSLHSDSLAKEGKQQMSLQTAWGNQKAPERTLAITKRVYLYFVLVIVWGQYFLFTAASWLFVNWKRMFASERHTGIKPVSIPRGYAIAATDAK